MAGFAHNLLNTLMITIAFANIAGSTCAKPTDPSNGAFKKSKGGATPDANSAVDATIVLECSKSHAIKGATKEELTCTTTSSGDKFIPDPTTLSCVTPALQCAQGPTKTSKTDCTFDVDKCYGPSSEKMVWASHATDKKTHINGKQWGCGECTSIDGYKPATFECQDWAETQDPKEHDCPKFKVTGTGATAKWVIDTAAKCVVSFDKKKLYNKCKGPSSQTPTTDTKLFENEEKVCADCTDGKCLAMKHFAEGASIGKNYDCKAYSYDAGTKVWTEGSTVGCYNIKGGDGKNEENCKGPKQGASDGKAFDSMAKVCGKCLESDKDCSDVSEKKCQNYELIDSSWKPKAGSVKPCPGVKVPDALKKCYQPTDKNKDKTFEPCTCSNPKDAASKCKLQEELPIKYMCPAFTCANNKCEADGIKKVDCEGLKSQEKCYGPGEQAKTTGDFDSCSCTAKQLKENKCAVVTKIKYNCKKFKVDTTANKWIEDGNSVVECEDVDKRVNGTCSGPGSEHVPGGKFDEVDTLCTKCADKDNKKCASTPLTTYKCGTYKYDDTAKEFTDADAKHECHTTKAENKGKCNKPGKKATKDSKYKAGDDVCGTCPAKDLTDGKCMSGAMGLTAFIAPLLIALWMMM